MKKKRLLVPKYVTKGNAHRRFIINFMFEGLCDTVTSLHLLFMIYIHNVLKCKQITETTDQYFRLIGCA